ncbi:MAG: hypothetical protein HZA34_01980 [Candidatus Pacebacteria bacterium]|nr:hypothetical protein [Candidatus Paceibacterota bacterium]
MANWKNDYQHIKVDALQLDIRNPRTDSGQSLTEADVIKELLDENVMQLAHDIVQNGYAPVSVFMVAEEGDGLVVVDGNRRLLALKIINDPSIIEHVVSKNDFTKAQELHTNQKEDLSAATSIIYPSRSDAERDMAKLHLAGIAIQQWKLIRQYRYFQRRIEGDELAIESLAELLAIDKSIIKKGIKTYQLFEIARTKLQDVVEEIGQDIFTDKNFKTDKFQRAIVNGEGERFLGYSFSEPKQRVTIANESVFLDRLRVTLIEIYDPNSKYFSSAQFSASDRLRFFQTIDSQFLSDSDFKKAEKERKRLKASGQKELFGLPTGKETQTRSEPSGGTSAPQLPPQPVSTPPGLRSVKDPKGLFWASKIPYQLTNTSLKKMYDELKNIEVSDFPNATHDLLRSFLECALVEYLTTSGEYAKIQKNQDHTPKLSELLTYIISNRLIDDDHVIANLESIKTNWDRPYSLQRMNSVNHNKNFSSSSSDVRSTWGMLEDLFRVVLVPKPRP